MNQLEPMYKQVKDLELGLLLSGLTILVKDTATYLTAAGIDNEMAEGFRLAYLNMLSDNRYYWQNFGPELHLPLNDAGLPQGFANDAAKCQADLRPLTEPELETEWLRAPGWHFFQTYTSQRRNDILRDISLEDLKVAFAEGKDPYESQAGESDICESNEAYKSIEGVVKQLAGTDREFKAFWYPVMLYLALLLPKTNFITLE